MEALIFIAAAFLCSVLVGSLVATLFAITQMRKIRREQRQFDIEFDRTERETDRGIRREHTIKIGRRG